VVLFRGDFSFDGEENGKGAELDPLARGLCFAEAMEGVGGGAGGILLDQVAKGRRRTTSGAVVDVRYGRSTTLK